MSRSIKFAKYQGLGNDFIILENLTGKLKLTEKHIKKLCDRHYGIGCDQLLIAGKSQKADYKMSLFNRDGSPAEMCGNGIRCMARYLYMHRITRKKGLKIETDAGIMTTKIIDPLVEVDMGEPVLDGPRVPVNRKGQVINSPLQTKEGTFKISAVSMGNPHTVIFVKNVKMVPLEKFGPAVENHPVFPRKTNVGFAQVITRKKISLRVWERGAGATLACGTGACAAVVAGALNKVTERNVTVSLPGGILRIRWDEKTNRILMTGPAEEVFTGTASL
ncbi:MAG: diaminopimelate epimerase [Nitrospinota bacterium]